jgi:hypothetical protein
MRSGPFGRQFHEFFDSRQSLGIRADQHGAQAHDQTRSPMEASMSESNGVPHSVPAIVTALRQRAAQTAAVQSELAKKVGEIKQHWLERIQKDSTEAWQLLFKLGGTPAVGEKIKLCEQWIEGAMKNAADDASYSLDSARALGELEMRFFSPVGTMETKASENGTEFGTP